MSKTRALPLLRRIATSLALAVGLCAAPWQPTLGNTITFDCCGIVSADDISVDVLSFSTGSFVSPGGVTVETLDLLVPDSNIPAGFPRFFATNRDGTLTDAGSSSETVYTFTDLLLVGESAQGSDEVFDFDFTKESTTTVRIQTPEPATLALFGFSLIGVGLYRRRLARC